jgi:glycolate oxidase FAD binding subunit
VSELISQYSEQIRAAAASKTPLRIRGGGTKDFYGYALRGEVLDVSGYRGVVEYEPTELVLTARAGTPLSEIEATLAQGGQMLACEPPHFGAAATLGGCVAAGFSGPRRAAAGSVRDFVLGAHVMNAAGEDLRFGGQVMKNVAGFDLSRLMAGSFGTLGVILEVSLKVLPRPEVEATLRFQMDEARAIDSMNHWAAQPLPVSATCFSEGTLTVRLSGSGLGVKAARDKLGGDTVPDGAAFWQSVREQTLPQYRGRLWRLSIKSTTPPLGLPGRQVIEWNGSLRWLATDAPAEQVFEAARRAGGHATLFRGGDGAPIMRLDPGVLALHRKLKAALDSHGIFGPTRLGPDF